MTNTTSSNTASTTALLAVDDLAIHVGGRALLQGISFRLHAGEALSLVGESGAGKSLMAQAIMGNLPPALRASGSITIDGVTTRAEDAASRRALWGRKLALLPQEPTVALNPLQRVAPQLAEVYTLLHGQPQGEAAARAQQELARAGLGQVKAAIKNHQRCAAGGQGTQLGGRNQGGVGGHGLLSKNSLHCGARIVLHWRRAWPRPQHTTAALV